MFQDGSGRCPSGIRCSISGILVIPVAQTQRSVDHSLGADFAGWRGVLHCSELTPPSSCSWR